MLREGEGGRGREEGRKEEGNTRQEEEGGGEEGNETLAETLSKTI